jgi:hypothetical protein
MLELGGAVVAHPRYKARELLPFRGPTDFNFSMWRIEHGLKQGRKYFFWDY